MWTALAVWSLWPTEIESGLLGKADIHDWHRGTRYEWGGLKLSSRRLLVLLDDMPEASKYRSVRERDGNWPEWQQMLKHLTNETSLHRSSLYAGGQNEYSATIYLDPIERVERIKELVEDSEESTEQFYDELGWT